MQNNMNVRQQEVAALVDDWESFFKERNVPMKKEGSTLVAICPACNHTEGIVVQACPARGYPCWTCVCGAHKKYHESYLGLICLFNRRKGVRQRGKMLGKIEAELLTVQKNGELPDWKFTFGKYEGKKLSSVPVNYVAWAVMHCHQIPTDVVQQVREVLGI